MNNQRGSITILLLVVMVLLVGMAALAVDYGYIYLQKQKLADAIDAAALAGAQDINDSIDKATKIAQQYATSNGVLNPIVSIDQVNKEITVTGEKYVPFFFAKAFGLNEQLITATAKAKLKPLAVSSGFAPIGVVQNHFIYGQIYKLKYGALDSYTGNFGALALGGTGAVNYQNNIVNGYNGDLKVGMKVLTETGNMSGPTQKGIQTLLDKATGNLNCSSHITYTRDCSRVMFVPIIDKLDVTGTGFVTIVGFAAFYIEGVSNPGINAEISGRFIRTVFPGDWADGSQDFGLYAVKLVY